MTKSFYLICFLAVCSLQFLPIAQAQFLPLDTDVEVQQNANTLDDIDIMGVSAEEEAILGEEENQFESELEFDENTPEEIQTAISENLAKIFDALGNGLITNAASRIQQNQSLENAALADAFGNVLVKDAQLIGDALGSLVADGVAAFREAQATNGDVGVAVGDVVINALREFNNSAGVIGESLQQELEASFANIENIDEDAAVLIAYSAEGVKRFINAIANRADSIGEIVAQSVNNAVSQGGSVAEQLGHTFASLVQAAEDNAEDVGDVVVEALSGIENINQELLAEIRADIINNFLKVNRADTVRSWITETVNSVRTDGRFGGSAQSVVEMIDRLGVLALEYLAENSRYLF